MSTDVTAHDDHLQGGPLDLYVELDRLAALWRDLPLIHAQDAAPLLRQLAQELADVQTTSGAGGEIRDLGPATALDQVRVLAREWSGQAETGDRARLAGRIWTIREEIVTRKSAQFPS